MHPHHACMRARPGGFPGWQAHHASIMCLPSGELPGLPCYPPTLTIYISLSPIVQRISYHFSLRQIFPGPCFPCMHAAMVAPCSLATFQVLLASCSLFARPSPRTLMLSCHAFSLRAGPPCSLPSPTTCFFLGCPPAHPLPDPNEAKASALHHKKNPCQSPLICLA